MLRTRLERMRGLAVGAGLSMLLALTGCGAFFQCEGKASCGTSSGGSGSGSGDYLYVSNAPNNNPTAISAYDISTGVLTPLSGSPYTVSSAPIALSVSPNNNFLYSATANGIYIYSLASSGVPSVVNSGNPINDGYPIIAMTMSPDGNYLFTIEEQGTGAYVIEEYSVASTGGLLQPVAPLALTSGATCTLAEDAANGVPATANCGLAVSPSGQFVIAAENSFGDILYPYSLSGGGITSSPLPQGINAPSSSNGELSVAVDSSNYAYISETSSISTYLVSSSLAISSPRSQDILFQNNETPRSITVSNGFAYTADQGTNTISAFSASAGVLTSLGAEVTGPTAVSAIGVDNSGKYLAAAGYGSPFGVELFSISSNGTLASLNQVAATGTNYAYPAVLALTHVPTN